MRARRLLAPLAALALPLALVPRAARPQAGDGIQFADGTAYAGIAFRHNSGAFGKKYLPDRAGRHCPQLRRAVGNAPRQGP